MAAAQAEEGVKGQRATEGFELTEAGPELSEGKTCKASIVPGWGDLRLHATGSMVYLHVSFTLVSFGASQNAGFSPAAASCKHRCTDSVCPLLSVF